MKAGYEFQGISKFPGSIKYEAQCRAAAARIKSPEIDANVIAAIIGRENPGWDMYLKSFDYAGAMYNGKWIPPTGSIGLGQATTEVQKGYPNYKTDIAVQLYEVGHKLEQDLLSFKARPYNPPNKHAESVPLYNAIRAYNLGNQGVRNGWVNTPTNYLAIVKGFMNDFAKANTPKTGVTQNSGSATDAKKQADAKKALETAKLKKIADDKAHADLLNKLNAEDLKDSADEKARLAKIKLANDKTAYNKQLALDNVAKAKRAKALKDATALKAKTAKANADAVKNAEHPKTPVKAKTPLQSALPIIGVLAIVLLAKSQK